MPSQRGHLGLEQVDATTCLFIFRFAQERDQKAEADEGRRADGHPEGKIEQVFHASSSGHRGHSPREMRELHSEGSMPCTQEIREKTSRIPGVARAADVRTRSLTAHLRVVASTSQDDHHRTQD
jgi:hypothetical protein